MQVARIDGIVEIPARQRPAACLQPPHGHGRQDDDGRQDALAEQPPRKQRVRLICKCCEHNQFQQTDTAPDDDGLPDERQRAAHGAYAVAEPPEKPAK